MIKKEYRDGHLLITPAILDNFNACGKGLDFIKSHFPEGFITTQVLNREIRHLPIHIVLWAQTQLPWTDLDKADIEEYLKIKNSSNYYQSHSIEKCQFISNSSFCYDSNEIYNSEDVRESENVWSSDDVWDGYNIWNSSHVEGSTFIDSSCEIDSSRAIFNSASIKNSTLLFGVQEAMRCYGVFNSSDLFKCALSRNIHHAQNRFLCDEYCDEDFDFAILNKKVPEYIFNRIFSDIEERFEENAENFLLGLEDWHFTNGYSLIRDFIHEMDLAEEIFEILPREFHTKTSKLLAYSITMCDDFLK